MDMSLSQLATDYLRMTMYFFYPIQQCAQHIYHTALPLSPLSTLRRVNQQGISRDRTHVAGFSGAPLNWGLLLTTISVGPRRPTAIATFAEKIAVACEDVVNIYDAVTFVLEQSLRTPQSVTRIQGSENGSILYSTHARSVRLWDIQTGGLIEILHTQSEINDTVISRENGHIACHLSDGSVTIQNGHTKNQDSFRCVQPVVTTCWLSSTGLAVATKNYIHICNMDARTISGVGDVFDPVWGMVLRSGELVVGTSKPGAAGNQESYSFSTITYGRHSTPQIRKGFIGRFNFGGKLTSPIPVASKIVSITPPNGVQVFNTTNSLWIKPPLLEKAKSLAVSLDGNLVVQTEGSVQIFSLDVLEREASGKERQLSHAYPLGGKHAVCLDTNRHITIIELETLRSIHPTTDTLLPESLSTKPSPPTREPCSRGPVAEFGVPVVVQAWSSQAPLPSWTEGAEEEALLGGSSPTCTRTVTLFDLPQPEIRVKEVTDGTILAKLPLEDYGSVGTGVAYDLTFDSETRFHLKVDGPVNHLQIPFDIVASPSGRYPYTIKQGEPVPLSQPRTRSPYTFDVNHEWVLDAQSRKICWIPPDIMRRGSGGHFWVRASLVMLGSDSVVRKLSFKDPDC